MNQAILWLLAANDGRGGENRQDDSQNYRPRKKPRIAWTRVSTCYFLQPEIIAHITLRACLALGERQNRRFSSAISASFVRAAKDFPCDLLFFFLYPLDFAVYLTLPCRPRVLSRSPVSLKPKLYQLGSLLAGAFVGWV